MHPVANNQKFVNASLADIVKHLNENTPEVQQAISEIVGNNDATAAVQQHYGLLNEFVALQKLAAQEQTRGDKDFVSRVDLVGVYQSVLSAVFQRIPALQGYGDRNPTWVATVIEEGIFKLGAFFKDVYEDVHGNQEPLISSILREWKSMRTDKASYPLGIPHPIRLPAQLSVALLADWGGDNPAARRVASAVRRIRPDIAIHLGDIYYGGTEFECELFLKNWPLQVNPQHERMSIQRGSSYALNGNHEMYTGGESYFNVVLKAFGQPQPFFCLENAYWRLIGLDTAYTDGRLKPSGKDDPLNAQWDWLADLLRNRSGKQIILLTQHQPVSAHATEFAQSAPLRNDINELLSLEGIGQDAIFGWFFGHEHRCAIYADRTLPYNARLIGNGCIPHEWQHENMADAGCTPFTHVNRRQDAVDSGAAVSGFVTLSLTDSSPEMLIQYIDEDLKVWGSEVWDATKGRLDGQLFQETDFDNKLPTMNPKVTKAGPTSAQRYTQ